MTDPLTVRVRVFQSDSLGDAMSKMRLWLDGEKIRLAMFKTGVDARGYTLDVGFCTIDDAERFRAQFRLPTAARRARFPKADDQAAITIDVPSSGTTDVAASAGVL